jgi:hypothetical protein
MTDVDKIKRFNALCALADKWRKDGIGTKRERNKLGRKIFQLDAEMTAEERDIACTMRLEPDKDWQPTWN